MRRRRFLGVALAGGLAGCNLTTDTDPEGFPRLGPISIVSDASDPKTVEIRVRFEGEVVHRREYEVPPADPTGDGRGRVQVEQTWGTESGEYFVDARLAGLENWRTVDVVSVDRYADCITLQLRVDDSDSLNWFTQNTCETPDGS